MADPAGVNTDQRLQALARSDKWYLSCGDGVLWAPPFPAWLHVPGFWDEAHAYYHPVAPLFAVALVDASGRAIPLERHAWRWRPDRVDVQWALPCGSTLAEHRYALPGGRLVSSWQVPDTLASSMAAPAALVAFTMQPGETTRDVRAQGGHGITWMRRVTDRRGAEADFALTLTGHSSRGDVAPRRCAVRSEGSVAHPAWLHTPFAERWERDGLPDEVRLEGISASGWIHAALALPVDGDVTFDIVLAPQWSAAADPLAASVHAAGPLSATVAESGRAALGCPSVADSTRAVGEFLDQFPRFACSDPYLARYYDYRLHGLHLNRLAGGAGHVHHPCIAEGIGYFHVPITYSAQCHLWEMRWSARSVGGVRLAAQLPRDAEGRRGIPRPHLQHAPAAHRLLPRELGRCGAGGARRPRRCVVCARGVRGTVALCRLAAHHARRRGHGALRRRRSVRDRAGIHVAVSRRRSGR